MARCTQHGRWLLSLAALALGCGGAQTGAGNGGALHAVAWPVDNVTNIGGYAVKTVGNPSAAPGTPSGSVCFGGGQDGLVLPVNPLDAQPEFTVQVLFKPDPSGPQKQQFLHLEDAAENRVMMEIRLASNGRWYLHSFARSGDQQQELAESDLQHDAGAWYWVALTYKEGELSHFVDAQQQGSATPALQPLGSGKMSVGMRLTNENGFKGCVRELRFATAALRATELARDVDAPSVLTKTP